MILDHRQFSVLQEGADNIGADLRRNYSGRGMFGKECIGIVGPLASLVHVVMHVTLEDPALALELLNISHDSMGLDMIFYWPGLQAPE